MPDNYAYFDGGFYYKDESGVVWKVEKTPYKEIPIYNLMTGTPKP